jgi:hypothetical protein
MQEVRDMVSSSALGSQPKTGRLQHIDRVPESPRLAVRTPSLKRSNHAGNQIASDNRRPRHCRANLTGDCA